MDFLQELAWRPTIGDPSIMGWVTVVAYGAGALCALLAARCAEPVGGDVRRAGLPWLLVAAVMGFLCLNKQLDLQSLFTEVGRWLARRQGWYEQRREAQKVFILVVMAVSAVGAVGLWAAFRQFWMRNRLLGVGLLFLLTFVGVRAVSFHHVDMLLHTSWIGIRFNWFMELSGIGLVTAAAVRTCVAKRNDG